MSGLEGSRRNLLYAIRNQFDPIHQTSSSIEAVEKVPLPQQPDIVVDYRHLLTLERKNVAAFILEGLEDAVNVRSLLDGVDAMGGQGPVLGDEERRGRRDGANEEGRSLVHVNIFQEAVGSVGNRGQQANVAAEVEENQIGRQENHGAESQDLAAVVGEIERLLAGLSHRYPTMTTLEQMTVATEVVAAIEGQRQLKARVSAEGGGG